MGEGRTEYRGLMGVFQDRTFPVLGCKKHGFTVLFWCR